MPAIMTHDFFGKDVLDRCLNYIGSSTDITDAFLLGNQGPDPLFYLALSPRYSSFTKLGSRMHDEFPLEQLKAFSESINFLEPDDRPIGRAYLLGFLCHYTLDSYMHPLVFSQQYAICDAGEPQLTRKNGGEVHATIESSFDEIVLATKRNETVKTYIPYQNILHGSAHVLDVINFMYEYMVASVFKEVPPVGLFSRAVKHFRRLQHLFYSPDNFKRKLLGGLEERFRSYSLFKAMTHRARLDETCEFDNHEHHTWEHPFIEGKLEDKSFWDLYTEALEEACERLSVLDQADLSLDTLRAAFGELDFSGRPLS